MGIAAEVGGGGAVAVLVVMVVVLVVVLGLAYAYWRGTRLWRHQQRERWRAAPAEGRKRAKVVLGGYLAAMALGLVIGVCIAVGRHDPFVIGGIIGVAAGIVGFAIAAIVALTAAHRRQE